MSLIGEIGTIEWSRRTNGILGRGERARFFAAATLKTLRVAPSMLAARAGREGSGPDPSDLTPPDTPFTRDVLEACADLDPMLVEHGIRSYLFARALGIVEGIECDEEALFAAAVLHDYAFGELESITGKCFTLVGAEVAAEVLDGSPLTPALQHDVLDAITLHLNPTVPREQGEIQHLVHDGILIDVLGLRALELSPGSLERTSRKHPRHGFTVRGTPALRGHARRVPGCRAAVLFSAGFGPALKLGAWHAADRG